MKIILDEAGLEYFLNLEAVVSSADMDHNENCRIDPRLCSICITLDARDSLRNLEYSVYYSCPEQNCQGHTLHSKSFKTLRAVLMQFPEGIDIEHIILEKLK